jgi:hypothetical protein
VHDSDDVEMRCEQLLDRLRDQHMVIANEDPGPGEWIVCHMRTVRRATMIAGNLTPSPVDL